MPYPLLSSLQLPILICLNYYHHLKNLGLTSLSYYHSVTVNVLLNALILSPCLSGSLLSDPCIVATYNHFYIIYLLFRATERNIILILFILFINLDQIRHPISNLDQIRHNSSNFDQIRDTLVTIWTKSDTLVPTWTKSDTLVPTWTKSETP